jgi:glutaconate CoA-transferase subunit A
VVHAPFGAHPSGCVGSYPVDKEHMQRYVEAAKSDETFAVYIQEVVFGVASHADYVARFVPAEWQNGGAAARKTRSA